MVEVGMHLQYSGAPEPKAGQPLIIGRLGKTCIMIRREQRIPGETLTAAGGGCQIVTLACIVSNDIFYHVQSDRREAFSPPPPVTMVIPLALCWPVLPQPI